MEAGQSHYIQVLKNHLFERQMSNPSYSLRAFARDVDIHPSSLSQILNGKRPLSFKDAQTVQKNLRLPPADQTRFMESVLRSRVSIDSIKIPEMDERHIIDDTHFQILAEYEHYTVLELFNLKDFVCTEGSVALRLDITPERAKEVIENLLAANLLTKTDKGFEKVHADIKTTEDISSLALRASHEETLRMGIDKLNEVAVELRDFSSSTLSLDPSKLPEAKTIIREFRLKMRALLATGEKTEVFQLAIQFYPLTKNSIEPKDLQ